MIGQLTDYMVHDHQQLSLLLNELQEQLGVLYLAKDRRGAAERLTELRRKISQALHHHVLEEEQILYPMLQDHMQGIAFTLERMRKEHEAGERTQEAFSLSLERLLQGGGNRREVVQSGRKHVAWMRNHLLEENGRLFPMVERGLDPATQQAARRAMEDLRQESSSRIAVSKAFTAQA